MHPDDHCHFVGVRVEVLVPAPFRHKGRISGVPVVALAVDDCVAPAVHRIEHRLAPVAVLGLPAARCYLEQHHAELGAMVALGDIHEESALRSLLIDEERLLLKVGHEGAGREALLVFGSLDDHPLVLALVVSFKGLSESLQVRVRIKGAGRLALANILDMVHVEELEEGRVADTDEPGCGAARVHRIVPSVGREIESVPFAPSELAVVDDCVSLAFEDEQLSGVDVAVRTGALARRYLYDASVDDAGGRLATHTDKSAVAGVPERRIGHPQMPGVTHHFSIPVPLLDIGGAPLHLDVVVGLDLTLTFTHDRLLGDNQLPLREPDD